MFIFQPRPVTALATAAGFLVLAILLFRRTGLKSWIHRVLAVYMALSVLWGIGHALSIWVGWIPIVSQLSAQTVFALRWMFPILILVLTMLFLERPGTRITWIFGGVWIAFGLLLSLDAFGLQAALIRARIASTPGELFSAVHSVGWWSFTASALILTIIDYVRIKSPLHRNRLMFWLIALVAAQMGEGLTLLDPRRFTLDVLQLGLGIRFGGAILLTSTLTRFNLPNLRSLTRLVLTSLPVTLISGAIFLGGFFLIRAIFDSGVPAPLNFVLAIGLALLLAALHRPLLTGIQRFIERFLLSQRYDPARALREYSAAISNILDLHQLVSVAVGIISEALENRRGVLLLTTELPDGGYDVRVVQGMGEVMDNATDFKTDSPILTEWQRGQQPLTQYDIDLLPRYREAPSAERRWLQRLDMEIFIPIRFHGTLIGVFALGHKASGDPYTSTDFDVMMTLGEQTAVALRNAQMVTDLKQKDTENRQLLDELTFSNRRLEKLDQAKTDFIDLASHELRTPLTQVRGYADILADSVREGTPSMSQMSQIGQGIGRAAIRLEEIITAMLDVSQIDAETLSISHAHLTIQSVLKYASDRYQAALKERQLTLNMKGIRDLPPIQGDFERLCQAFSNVIGNSIKFTPDGGSIHISGRVLDSARGDGADRFLEIAIMDTGIGIDKEDQDLIFEKFYRVGSVDLHSTGQTKFKGGGPGLGLPIAKGVILAHNGKIWVESEGEDETRMPGSTFHIILPATTMPNANKQKDQPVKSKSVSPQSSRSTAPPAS